MVYTITFNPALDYTMAVKNLAAGSVNRAVSEKIRIGGKGINVSVVLKNLGIENTALGFIAGFTGEEIKRRLENYGVGCGFVYLESGMSRINVKIDTDTETQINASGPDIPTDAVEMLLARISEMKNGDMIILSGSVPKSVPDDMYAHILENAKARGVIAVVDASGNQLSNTLKYSPFLIKPNNFELEEIFGSGSCADVDGIEKCAKKMRAEGAQNVLVSMAGDGALLAAADGKTYFSAAPSGRVINSVGAGDSMVAGFVYGSLTYGDYSKALMCGIAAGSASAFSESLCTKAAMTEILEKMSFCD